MIVHMLQSFKTQNRAFVRKYQVHESLRLYAFL